METTVKNTQSKRREKKQTNIKWNSRLFFQIGVIVSLLIVFFIMQTNFEMRVAEAKPPVGGGFEESPMIEYVIDVDKPKPIKPIKILSKRSVPPQRVVKSDVFEVKPDDSPIVETPIAATGGPITEAPTAPITSEEPPIGSVPHSIINVEFVPVFPGCETQGTNAEKIECMSSKINSFINKNFRKELLEDLGSNETYKIYVNFKIDSEGYVTDVKANSHNENLKKEAQRVINNLPTMKPGKQGDKNVDVLYTVPIVFKIQ